jgi:pentatricopeptide repeat protein
MLCVEIFTSHTLTHSLTYTHTHTLFSLSLSLFFIPGYALNPPPSPPRIGKQVLYTVMIAVCAKQHRVERALAFYDEMQAMGQEPTEVTYNALVLACARRADYYEEAFETVERMREAGFVPDQYTANALLLAASRRGDLDTALAQYRRMRQSGIASPRTHATLLSAFARSQRHVPPQVRAQMRQAAATLFAELAAAPDFSPDLPLLHAHLMVSVEGLCVRDALAALRLFPAHQVVPDLHTYTALLKLFANTRRVGLLRETFLAMRQAGVSPDRVAYKHLIWGLCNVNYMSSALMAFLEMCKLGLQPEQHHVRLLLERVRNRPDVQAKMRRALSIHAHMDPGAIDLLFRLPRHKRRTVYVLRVVCLRVFVCLVVFVCRCVGCVCRCRCALQLLCVHSVCVCVCVCVCACVGTNDSVWVVRMRRVCGL